MPVELTIRHQHLDRLGIGVNVEINQIVAMPCQLVFSLLPLPILTGVPSVAKPSRNGALQTCRLRKYHFRPSTEQAMLDIPPSPTRNRITPPNTSFYDFGRKAAAFFVSNPISEAQPQLHIHKSTPLTAANLLSVVPFVLQSPCGVERELTESLSVTGKLRDEISSRAHQSRHRYSPNA